MKMTPRQYEWFLQFIKAGKLVAKHPEYEAEAAKAGSILRKGMARVASPQTQYHGAIAGFKTLDVNRAQAVRKRRALWFTPRPEEANLYTEASRGRVIESPQIFAAHLHGQILDAGNITRQDAIRLRRAAAKLPPDRYRGIRAPLEALARQRPLGPHPSLARLDHSDELAATFIADHEPELFADAGYDLIHLPLRKHTIAVHNRAVTYRFSGPR